MSRTPKDTETRAVRGIPHQKQLDTRLNGSGSDWAKLKITLDGLYERRSSAYLNNDPLLFCHRYSRRCDQEITGLIASCFAYGNVKQILKSLESIFTLLGTSPRSFVESFNPRDGLMLFKDFRHRFNTSTDLCALLFAIRRMIEQQGSINECFRKFYDRADGDMAAALNGFCTSTLAFDYQPVFGKDGIPGNSGFPFLFPSPASGSACKRICLYLRWMVRPADGIDLGAWRGIAPSRLIMPVDTHVQRIARFLGLTSRRQANWKMAIEITKNLKEFDPADPVKYDFALAHIGISENCGRKRGTHCGRCALREICRPQCISAKL